MSSTGDDEGFRVRFAGLCLVVVGCFLLAYGPYHRAESAANVPNPADHALFGAVGGGSGEPVQSLFVGLVLVVVRALSTATVVPAVLVVWGGRMLRTGRVRAVTPAWAAGSVVLALAPVAVLVHIEPVGAGVCDTVPCVDPVRPEWDPPAGVVGTTEAMAQQGAVALGSLALFFCAGVGETRGERRRWTRLFVPYAVGWVVPLLVADPPLAFVGVFWLCLSIPPGAAFLRFGRWVAERSGAGEHESGAAIGSGAASY